MTYGELKKYFEENRDKLPESVGAGFIVVPDVRKTVSIYVGIVEGEIRKGVNLNKSYVAKAAKRGLLRIYELIQDETTHGVKELNFTRFSNFRRQN